MKENGSYKYRSKAKWNNSVLFQWVIALLIWLPLAYFGTNTALQVADLKITLLIFSLLLIWALVLFYRAQLKIRFPAVEVTSEHLVLNRPMNNRTVYNLSEVRGPRFIGNTLYFRHLGWPVFTSLGSIPKDYQAKLLELLSAQSLH